jgi:hypothetical protein
MVADFRRLGENSNQQILLIQFRCILKYFQLIYCLFFRLLYVRNIFILLLGNKGLGVLVLQESNLGPLVLLILCVTIELHIVKADKILHFCVQVGIAQNFVS